MILDLPIIGPPNRNVRPPEGFLKQLAEARQEWRRKHPTVSAE
jgi:hypothetical protein